MTESPRDRILALIDADTWPTPSHVVDEMDDVLDRDEVAYTVGALMDEGKAIYAYVDGFTFLTTPDRLRAEQEERLL